MAGLVLVGGVTSDKAGARIEVDAQITIKQRPRFVSRAGEKLAHALGELRVDPRGATGLDVGASTGGFVDCLLQHGAVRVIALDVGRGQLDVRLRNDARVVVMEKVNARHLTKDLLPCEPDFLTMDVSFISVTKVLPAVVACMAERFEGLILVKPQFEAGRAAVGRGGIVRDPEVHRAVLMERGAFVLQELGVQLHGMCRSGLRGADGNVEFFIHVGRGGEKGVGLDRLEALVDGVLAQTDTTEVLEA
jgi:23S rRNA (cytidine1920-2'-O)/16S rRNA (cytidine1409-2'-O)-methyltransferase